MMQFLVAGLESNATARVSMVLRLRWPDARVATASDVQSAMRIAAGDSCDAILVDPKIADRSLEETLQMLRSVSNGLLLVIERKGDELEAVTALNSGADDYIRAPENPIELGARISALLHLMHRDGEESHVIQAGRLVVDGAARQATLDGEQLPLTSTDFRLLYLLATHHSVVTYEMAEQVLWDGHANAKKLLKKYVMRLRKKLSDNSEEPHWIVNVHGVGYRFIADGRRNAAGTRPVDQAEQRATIAC